MAKPGIEEVPQEELNALSKEQTSLPALDTIKKNIQDIKTSVEQVRQQKEILEKEKPQLSKEVLDQKEKDIVAKKLEIANKKKETLDLITKIKIDAKLANLDKQVSQEIADDEKYLNELDVNSFTFWEKLKSVPGKIWDWSKENPKTAIAVTL